jgi:hypothetical protein
VSTALQLKETHWKLQCDGLAAAGGSAQQFAQRIKKAIEARGMVVKDAGMTAQ